MGITQVDPREAERFAEGLNRNSKMLKKEVPKDNSDNADLGPELMDLGHLTGDLVVPRYKSAWIGLTRDRVDCPCSLPLWG